LLIKNKTKNNYLLNSIASLPLEYFGNNFPYFKTVVMNVGGKKQKNGKVALDIQH